MSKPRLIDGRDMPPSGSLEPALGELATRAPGDELVMLLRCQPMLLYFILSRNRFRYHSEMRSDGTNEVRIRKA